MAIIGASYLQMPLIEKAKEMGIETHVFAWAAGDVGETAADHFYPISIVEKEEIYHKCKEIGVDGIVSIASDLAVVAVNYVAARLGLSGNSEECTLLATNKHHMRKAFAAAKDPSPASILVENIGDLEKYPALHFPVIVKPLDRSGSRGIQRLEGTEGLAEAIEEAKAQGFVKQALVEEYVEGQEYSIECISWKGEHRLLAITRKYTTEAPRFIETAHLEPGCEDPSTADRIRQVVFHALDTLKICYGASHSELKVAADGSIRIIEIGARMGGDFIGSHLVEMSTGFDFVRAVIETALGVEPAGWKEALPDGRAAGVRFILTHADLAAYDRLKAEHPEFLRDADIAEPEGHEVTDSATRFGYFLMQADRPEELEPYLS